MEALVTMNAKVAHSDKVEFSRIAESLGMPASTAIKVLIKRFIEVGGFPFDVRLSERSNLDWNAKDVIRTTHDKKGNLLMPVAWRDDDDKDE